MTASADKPVKIFQLAKQLNTSHRDIINFLKSEGIEASLNKALEPDVLALVMSHYKDEIKIADGIYDKRERQRQEDEEKRKNREVEKKSEEAARQKVQDMVLKSLKEEPKPEPPRTAIPLKPASSIKDKSDVIMLEKEKEMKKKALEEQKNLEEQKKKRQIAEKEAAQQLAKEDGQKQQSNEYKKKKKKVNKPAEAESKESFDNKLEKLKQRHKHATKRIQISEMESRLDKFRQTKAADGKEAPKAPVVNKNRKKKKKVNQEDVNKSIRATLASMSDNKPKKKKYKSKHAGEDQFIEEENGILEITEFISVDELAKHLDVTATDIIGTCMGLGLMVTINQRLDWDTIELVASEFDVEVQKAEEYTEEVLEEEDYEDYEMESRSPVVTVMGHVDHGKTSILDYIRHTSVVSGESGGITQHIGAYRVKTSSGSIVTFLDTPGHEAFTAMRARGAQVTDIVVIVVAADDGVMPQTKEAINHAHAAGVSIIIAINKMDKPAAEPDRVIRELSENGVLVEDWGGKVQCIQVSAKTGQNIDKLLDAIMLEADMLELESTHEGYARGVVIESRLDKGLGPVASVLIQRGELNIGDAFITGRFAGRVRAMLNEYGEKIRIAGPADPIQIQGFDDVPQAGDKFIGMAEEKEARRIASERQKIYREQEFRAQSLQTLDEIGRQIAEGKTRELKLVIKGDVDGSIEALADSFMKLSTKEVAVKVIHRGIGMISETDVNLAAASRAVIIGFHVNTTGKALELSKERSVDIRNYTVIYDALEDVRLALEGLLEPEKVKEILGLAEVRQLIRISRMGVIAGSLVTFGKITRGTTLRVLRGENEIYKGYLTSLKRFKDDAREVQEGYECGIYIDGFNDYQEGDIVETFTEKSIKRKLEA